MVFKRFVATLCVTTMLVLGSIATTPADPGGTLDEARETSIVVVNEKKDGCEFAKSEKHDWQSGDAHLSNVTFVSDGIAYMKIYSGIGVGDVHQIWADFMVIMSQYKTIKDVELFLNSPGGSAFDGLALADLLVRAQDEWGFKIHVWANGIIASAAVPVFAVCRDRSAARSTIFMVHEAALWKWPGRESASDIRSQNELMKILRDQYIGHMVRSSTLSKDQWEAMEGRTTWFNVSRAREFGLIDN